MADQTEISWADSTFNPWWGCTRIAPGCDNCYAEAIDKRWGGDYWNPKVAPRLTKHENRKQVIKWNKQAVIDNKRRPVFCGSMMDWCDIKAPDGALDELWELIRQTPMLDWQLLTKRATRIEQSLPYDWADGYDNVWLGVTVEDQKYGIPRMEALKNIPAKVRFLSVEPLLEDLGTIDLSGIDWVIVGGESGPKCRPMLESWALNVINQSKDQDVAVWFKQWGGSSKGKGGCLINGSELKEWPKEENKQ